ncbi:hypothetical protein, partial [Streptococcus gordonii]
VNQYTGATTKSEEKKDASAEKELAHLKKVLKTIEKQKAAPKVEDYEISSVIPNKVKVELLVTHSGKTYQLPVKDGMKVTYERKNAPGKLTF